LEKLSLGQLDRWRSDGPPDEARSRELAEFVELRAASPDEISTRGVYLDLLEMQPGELVLDVGCGSGVVTREMARRLRPDGRVIGVEPNQHLLALAAELAERDGLSSLIEWRDGDARGLPFDDGSFDVVMCATVLAHIPDSDPVVAELARVLRPGGRIGVFEIDPESFLVAHPDRVMTRRILAAATDYGFANALVSRRLPALLTAAGVEDLRFRAFTSLENDPAGFLAKAAELRPVVAAQSGAVTQAEGEAWLRTLRDEMKAGRYLGGTTYVYAWGRKPGA
jgi:ubiquinone/menaquinone biosynthesis C-methylase UbiE